MKFNTKPLPGMMELLPEWQLEFNRILRVIEKHHAAFGYAPINTPIIERTETLLAKAGGETEKQIYRFNKGDNDLSLRFDLTVPTARYVADNFGQLQFPFKRSQIGKVYRGERAQRGRFREFYQCDIDVIGRDKLSIKYDAEVIAVIYSIFRDLDFGAFTIRINNRNITSGLLGGLNLSEKSAEIMSLIDRAEKISQDEFLMQLDSLSLGDASDKIKSFINISGSNKEIISKLKLLSGEFDDNSQFLQGINELEQVIELLMLMGVEERFFSIDMKIVRGLDYYTGTIFETNLDDFKKIGSVASGGRYDNLSRYYSKDNLPGVGASIGLTRLFWIMKDLGIINEKSRTPAEFLILPLSSNELGESFRIAKILRDSGYNVEVLLEDMNLKKAFRFADKRGVEFVLALGEREVAEGKFMFKNMRTGETIPLKSIVE